MVVGKIYGKIIMVDGIHRRALVAVGEIKVDVGPLTDDSIIESGRLLYQYAEVSFSQRNKGEPPNVSVKKWEQG